MTQKWDVVIVGGGLAGYVAANYLTKANLSILIIEKSKNVGGRARTNKIDQQYFNLGPHALYKKGKAISTLEELGIHLNGKERIEWVAVLMKVMSIDPEKLAELTFQQWVKQVVSSKIVESLLYTLGRLATYCHAPDKVSAKVMISNLKIAMKGTLYLDGGW